LNWVIGIQAQKCQGLALIWVSVATLALPPLPVAFDRGSNPPIWLDAPASSWWPSYLRRPDIPPPRHF